MCGRYSLGKKPRSWPQDADDFQPRFNIAPSQQAPVLLKDEVLKQMRWGLIPPWAKDEAIGYKTINARAETLARRPIFRACLRTQRCVVPADGFYEWKKGGRVKVPFRFTLKDDEPFAFAGLWEKWRPRGRDVVESFMIITTDANDLVRTAHDRMPAMLDADGAAQWLDSSRDFASLQPLLRPFSDRQMHHYAVSTKVNDARFDDPSCIEPVPELQPMLQFGQDSAKR